MEDSETEVRIGWKRDDRRARGEAGGKGVVYPERERKRKKGDRPRKVHAV